MTGSTSLPDGYVLVTAGDWRVALAEELGDCLDSAALADPAALAETGERRFRGRGRPALVRLADGTFAVLRQYLHGGALRRVTRGTFLGRPRPLVELRATECARRAGVRVPKVLAAFYRPVAGLFHAGFILTRFVEDAEELPDVVADPARAGAALRATGVETRRLHDSGVWHADLHVKNVLVTADGPVLLDFDRARVLCDVTESGRRGNLFRFHRSLVKLSLDGPLVPLRARLRFFHGYYGRRLARDERDGLAAQCRRTLSWHRLGWRLAR